MQGNEKSAGKSQKKSWFQGLQSEFRKIVWTDRNELIKQTIVVVCVSIVLCVLISVMDSFILEGIEIPKMRGGYWYRLIDAPDSHR